MTALGLEGKGKDDENGSCDSPVIPAEGVLRPVRVSVPVYTLVPATRAIA